MIPRYSNGRIAAIFSDERKLAWWQRVEIAALTAKQSLGMIPHGTLQGVRQALDAAPIDLARCAELEEELRHDLNAFVFERQEKLPLALRRFFHDGLTSYDTEEPAFALMLTEAHGVVREMVIELRKHLVALALKYRHTPMNARTHGQEAELQSFGKRVVTWIVELDLGIKRLDDAKENLRYSKLSGAIGNYGALEPNMEEVALDVLGLVPFVGATQIMPRAIYLPLADALLQIVETIDKIATDIRLMARSGRPLVQEPFGKKQTGSSAMPQKKNTISTEKDEGMAVMALGFHTMIALTVKTWEERAIHQSSVERVAWPDLFHVAAHAIETLAKVAKGLRVYPDNMLLEIDESRGSYAAAAAKDFLKEYGAAHGLSPEDAYRIVQLAAFNIFEPREEAAKVRVEPPTTQWAADALVEHAEEVGPSLVRRPHLAHVIRDGALAVSDQLAATQEDVDRWNHLLGTLFADEQMRRKWKEIFKPSHHLRNEGHIFARLRANP